MVARPLTVSKLNREDGFVKTVVIPSASVLTLNSVGYALMTAPVNTQNAIVILEIFARITAGTAYTSLHDINILYGTVGGTTGATVGVITATGFLDQTAATGVYIIPGSVTATKILSPALGVSAQMGTGDPATGTSPLTIKLKYKIHKII